MKEKKEAEVVQCSKYPRANNHRTRNNCKQRNFCPLRFLKVYNDCVVIIKRNRKHYHYVGI